MTTIIPPIIVIVRVVTRVRRNLILAGSSSDVLRMNSDFHLVEVKITDSSIKRLDKALAAFAPAYLSLSRSYATRLIQRGAVSLNGVIIKEQAKLDMKRNQRDLKFLVNHENVLEQV